MRDNLWQTEKNWRLCGGTFFILISDARNPMPSHAERYMGKQSGITEPETLLALARIVSPDIPDPLRSEDKSFRDGTLDSNHAKAGDGVHSCSITLLQKNHLITELKTAIQNASPL
jgi:hypothetical protein